MFDVRSLRFNSACSRPGRAILTIALVGFLSLGTASADSPSLTAVLSNSEVAVGETAELQIRVTGAGEANAPDQIAVDGLEIRRTGTSRPFEMHNFNTTSSVIYN